MSTRSFTGGITERGVEGRYVHFDGYPEARLPLLRAIIARDGAPAALRTLLSAGQGWSYLSTDRTENPLGERAEVVAGYGLAYRDAEDEDPRRLADVIEDVFIEHAYVIHPKRQTVQHFDLTTDTGRAEARKLAENWRDA